MRPRYLGGLTTFFQFFPFFVAVVACGSDTERPPVGSRGGSDDAGGSQPSGGKSAPAGSQSPSTKGAGGGGPGVPAAGQGGSNAGGGSTTGTKGEGGGAEGEAGGKAGGKATSSGDKGGGHAQGDGGGSPGSSKGGGSVYIVGAGGRAGGTVKHDAGSTDAEPAVDDFDAASLLPGACRPNLTLMVGGPTQPRVDPLGRSAVCVAIGFLATDGGLQGWGCNSEVDNRHLTVNGKATRCGASGLTPLSDGYIYFHVDAITLSPDASDVPYTGEIHWF